MVMYIYYSNAKMHDKITAIFNENYIYIKINLGNKWKDRT